MFLQRLSLLLCLWVFWGCDALQPDRASLQATTPEAVVRPRCDACHAYAPRTGAHRYHLDTTRQANGTPYATSCYQCHSASIATRTSPVTDSLFMNADGSKMYWTHSWPWRPFDRSELEMVATESVDSLPVYSQTRTNGWEQPQWITRQAAAAGLPGHANAQVDVVMPKAQNYIDAQGVEHRAHWNPQRLSCGAVKCHESRAMDTSRYIWKDIP